MPTDPNMKAVAITLQGADPAPPPAAVLAPRGDGGEASAVADLRLTPGEIFERYGPYVFRLLRRLGVRDADVDDVCQEVFFAVHRQLPGFEGRSKLRTWVYAIARNQAATYRARAHRRYEHLAAEPDEHAPAQAQRRSDPPGDPQRSLERTRLRETLDQLLDQLDDEKRSVFVLYEIEELPMREVAEVVGCPLQTGYSRLHSARRVLRALAARKGVKP